LLAETEHLFADGPLVSLRRESVGLAGQMRTKPQTVHGARRRRRSTRAALAFVALVAFGACKSAPPVTESQEEYLRAPGAPEPGARDLGSVLVLRLLAASVVGERRVFEVELSNPSAERLVFAWWVEWWDARGAPVADPDMRWRTESLGPGDATALRLSAPPGAVQFELKPLEND